MIIDKGIPHKAPRCITQPTESKVHKHTEPTFHRTGREEPFSDLDGSWGMTGFTRQQGGSLPRQELQLNRRLGR